MAGAFGYELDITKLTQEEKEQAASLNEEYNRYAHINREGDYYRIASYREKGQYDCWQVVSADRKEFLLTYVQVGHNYDWRQFRLRLEGLEPGTKYRLEGTDRIFSGEMLMNGGYLQETLWGDYCSVLLHFIREC